MRSNVSLDSVCISLRACVLAWFANILLLALLFASGGLSASQGDAGQSAFWRMSKGGVDAGYVLGTIHSEDPRVLDFPADFIAQLTSCQVFAMELVPDMATIGRINEFMQYPDAETLERTLGKERYERVMAALAAYHVPLDRKTRMKVWAVMMTLSVPIPETGLFMDFSLSLRAGGSGMTVSSLETLEQQLSFLENMPVEYQLALLDQALSDYQRVDELNHEMVDVYLTGDLARLQRLSEEQFSQRNSEIRDYFLRGGILERNQHMVENLLNLLQEGRVFVAVGALHLPGPGGLLALLHQHGYDLEPMPMPFSQLAGPG
jgi:uncharacterized protein YbaP (TraB family)